MSNLSETNNRPLAQTFTASEIETIKRTIAVGATDDELKIFLYNCAAYRLNPFLREIFFVKMRGRATIIVSRDAYLKIAIESGQLDGLEHGTIDDEKTGKPIKGWAKVYRKDMRLPFYCEAKMSEYERKSKTPEPSVWETHPSAMIIKVAEAMALKRMFSISGLVTHEELQGVGVEDFEVVAINQETKILLESNAEIFNESELTYWQRPQTKDKALAALKWVQDEINKRNPTQNATYEDVTPEPENEI